MDPRRSPQRVFLAHALDEITQATIDLRAPCPVLVGNLNSNIFVMESAQDRDWQEATEPMTLAWDRCILVQ